MADQDKGDCIDNDNDDVKTIEDIVISETPSSFKFSFSLSMEAQIHKLKLSMESWREIIVQAKRVIMWEKQYYPTALLAGSTILFTLIWISKVPFVTCIALLFLAASIADYLVPTLAVTYFKPEDWTAELETEYYDTCTSLIITKTKTLLSLDNFFKMRSTSPKKFNLIIMSSLIALAWLGNNVNNLFFAYITFTVLILLPGAEKKGVFGNLQQTLSDKINQFMNETKKAK